MLIHQPGQPGYSSARHNISDGDHIPWGSLVSRLGPFPVFQITHVHQPVNMSISVQKTSMSQLGTRYQCLKQWHHWRKEGGRGRGGGCMSVHSLVHPLKSSMCTAVSSLLLNCSIVAGVLYITITISDIYATTSTCTYMYLVNSHRVHALVNLSQSTMI